MCQRAQSPLVCGFMNPYEENTEMYGDKMLLSYFEDDNCFFSSDKSIDL